MPSRTTDVLIPVGKAVEVDTEQAEARVLIVEGTLVFSRTRAARLALYGNLIVRQSGRLEMRPGAPEIVHTIQFLGIDERRFVGGHTMEPLPSDVGLWVQDGALLDVQGSPKLAWGRLAGSAAAGDSRLVLAQDPVGWRVGDELAITPTLPPTVWGHYDAYDYATVTRIVGREVTIDRPLRFAHPAVEVRPGVTMTAEVLNLTRNVRIEGTPQGRAHVIFNMALRPQALRYAALRYMGPQRPPDADGNVVGVLGRYGVHFHRMGDAARGSMVEGVVVRDVGHIGVNAHGSHGVVVRRTIVHNGYAPTAFGWDPIAVDTRTKNFANGSHDVLYEECVASRITVIPAFRGYRLSGFSLVGGKRNRLINSVAVGVQGNKDASGAGWGEGESVEATKTPDGEPWGVWDVQGFVGHNNRRHGWFVWQNTDNPHVVGDGSVLYHNGGLGINHGAYLNVYRYRNMTLFGNGEGGIALRARGAIVFENLHIDQGGMTDYAVHTAEHALSSEGRTLFLGGVMRGYRKAGVALLWPGSSGVADKLDVVDVQFGGNEFWVSDSTAATSSVRWQRGGDALLLQRRDQPGEYVESRWNASVTRIPVFR